ncbi:MAG: hypothetical protein ACRDH9_07570 [Actinomycetota bacterium]
MRRALIPAIALVALAAGPASAQTPEPTPPCPTSEQFTTLGLTGMQESFAPEPVPSVGTDIINDEVTPMPYHEESVTRFRYRVDVSGSTAKPFAKTANVTLTLSWDNDSDFDVYVYDKDDAAIGESVSFNPLDGSGETIGLVGVAHCTDIRIDVVNYLGLPDSALVLDAKLTNLKP